MASKLGSATSRIAADDRTRRYARLAAMSRAHGPRLHRSRGERRRRDGDPGRRRRRRSRHCPGSGCGPSRASTRPNPWASSTSPSSATRSSPLDVPAGDDPAARCARPAGLAQGRWSAVRSPGPRALGPARAGPGPADLRSRADRGGAPARGPLERRRARIPRRPRSCWSSRTRRRATPVRARAALGRRALAGAARLGRDGRHRASPAGGHRRSGRRPPDRPLGRRDRPLGQRSGARGRAHLRCVVSARRARFVSPGAGSG